MPFFLWQIFICDVGLCESKIYVPSFSSLSSIIYFAILCLCLSVCLSLSLSLSISEFCIIKPLIISHKPFVKPYTISNLDHTVKIVVLITLERPVPTTRTLIRYQNDDMTLLIIELQYNLSKTATLKKSKKMVFKTNYRLMKVISVVECSPWSILQYF